MPKQFQRSIPSSIIYFGLVSGKSEYLKDHQVCDPVFNLGKETEKQKQPEVASANLIPMCSHIEKF